MRSTQPSSAAAKSPTVGVPSPPSRTGCSVPGSRLWRDRFAGVQVGPMCCDLQPPGFGGDQGVFVGLRRGEGAGGIQLDQIIFEHTFNIWVEADRL